MHLGVTLTPTIPTTEPTEAIAGDTWRWTKSVAGYPASDGWALAYAFRGASVLDVTAEGNGDAWDVTVPATETAGLVAGAYSWIARATKAGETYTVASGTLTVRPNLATATAGQLQSHEERCIPLLEAAIANRVRVDMKAYTLTETAATREELDHLERLLTKYRLALTIRRNGGRLPPYAATFTRPA